MFKDMFWLWATRTSIEVDTCRACRCAVDRLG